MGGLVNHRLTTCAAVASAALIIALNVFLLVPDVPRVDAPSGTRVVFRAVRHGKRKNRARNGSRTDRSVPGTGPNNL